jgi:hypothetical protein
MSGGEHLTYLSEVTCLPFLALIAPRLRVLGGRSIVPGLNELKTPPIPARRGATLHRRHYPNVQIEVDLWNLVSLRTS